MTEEIVYICKGRLIMLPVWIIIFSLVAFFFLLLGYTWSFVVGLVFGLLGFALGLLLSLFVVLRLSVRFEGEHVVLRKTGLLFTGTLRFRAEDTSVHYLRTRYMSDKVWVVLMFRERGKVYKVFAWRGAESMKGSFFDFVHGVRLELERRRARPLRPYLPSEIISRDESIMISPFRARLLELMAPDPSRVPESQSSAVVIEDLDMIDLGSSFGLFFLHQKK